MSKPPLPSARSTAAVFTTTSSPTSTGPVRRSNESALRVLPPTSTVSSAAGPGRSTAVTVPRRSARWLPLSVVLRLGHPGAVRDNAEHHVEHRLERVHGHALVDLVRAEGAVGDVEALEA